MQMNFSELKNHNFELSNINVFLQRPVYRELKQKSRIPNGFLFITKGKCIYSFNNEEIELNPKSVIYLPRGSKHLLQILTDDIEFYRLDFDAKIKNELVYFSDSPLKITDNASVECIDTVKNLLDNYKFIDDTIAKTELMCKIFRLLQENVVSKRYLKLFPAVNYIYENITTSADCRFLASMCYLSVAQFYRLFSEEFNCTPLEYRDKLLITRAKTLLESGDYTVTEVSESLGFESVAYFSRFFKKHTGVSPKNYITL